MALCKVPDSPAVKQLTLFLMISPPSPRVAKYFDSLAEGHANSLLRQAIALAIRTIILDTLPECDEQLKWNIPVYVHSGSNLAYLNVNAEGVYLGFMYGAKLPDPAGIFEGQELKQIRHLRFDSLETGPWEELPFYLQEAAIFNQGAQKKIP